VDDVGGAADPAGAVGLQEALAGGEPGAVEGVIGVGAAGDVPLAFIDADNAAGVAGDAVAGEEVGRGGEDEVDGGFGEGGEDFEGVALVDAEVVLVVADDRSGERRAPLDVARDRPLDPSTRLRTFSFAALGFARGRRDELRNARSQGEVNQEG
jgi:hypothetical protein